MSSSARRCLYAGTTRGHAPFVHEAAGPPLPGRHSPLCIFIHTTQVGGRELFPFELTALSFRDEFENEKLNFVRKKRKQFSCRGQRVLPAVGHVRGVGPGNRKWSPTFGRVRMRGHAAGDLRSPRVLGNCRPRIRKNHDSCPPGAVMGSSRHDPLPGGSGKPNCPARGSYYKGRPRVRQALHRVLVLNGMIHSRLYERWILSS